MAPENTSEAALVIRRAEQLAAAEDFAGAAEMYRAALKHHPLAVPAERPAGFIGAVPVGFIEETRPELIVGMEIFLEAFLRSEVRREYVQIRGPIYVEQDLRIARSPILWGSRFMHTFIRRDAAERGQDAN